MRELASVLDGTPLLANKRAGSWYVAPEWGAGTAACFKSTDGHASQRHFSLARLNMNVLKLACTHGCVTLVDATRRKKRQPDAFSRTVPIWVGVMNACRQRVMRGHLPPDGECAAPAIEPHSEVPESDCAAMNAALASYVDACVGHLTSEAFGSMRAPLRVFWFDAHDDRQAARDQLGAIIQARHIAPYLAVVCLSVSREEPAGPAASARGFVHIKGAGDDEEAWSCGLQPAEFWGAREALLRAPTDEACLDVVQALVAARLASDALVTTRGACVRLGALPIFLADSAAAAQDALASAGFVHGSASLVQFDGQCSLCGAGALYHVHCTADGSALHVGLPVAKRFRDALEACVDSILEFVARAFGGVGGALVILTDDASNRGAALACLTVVTQFEFCNKQHSFVPRARTGTLSKDVVRHGLSFVACHVTDASVSQLFVRQIRRALLSDYGWRGHSVRASRTAGGEACD